MSLVLFLLLRLEINFILFIEWFSVLETALLKPNTVFYRSNIINMVVVHMLLKFACCKSCLIF